jgi:hypothetical protein
MIEKIHIAALRNSEFSQFINDVLSIVGKHTPAALQVEKQANQLRRVIKEADALFKVKTGFKGTEKLAELDQRRDKTITGITQIANGMINHPKKAMAQHAEALHKHLKRYGGGAVARENYAAETAIIKSILKDWAAQADLKAAIKALGLEEWQTALESENNAFNEQYLLRNTEMSDASPDTLRTKRLEAAEAYINLQKHVNARFILEDGAEPFGKAVKEINALIGQYTNLLASRKGRSDAGEEEETEDLAMAQETTAAE